jgi:hypothetical protein
MINAALGVTDPVIPALGQTHISMESEVAEQWTEEKIRALSSERRRKLYQNAKSHRSAQGETLAKLIEEVGLSNPLQSGIDMDDPLVFRIYEIINSQGGKEAAVRAVKDGLPALAGVDPLLAANLGRDYGKHNQTTHTAGSLVAILMRELGYRDTNRAALPEGCVAKTGQLWTLK